MVTDAIELDKEPNQSSLSFGGIEDFINPPSVPDDDEVPDELKPKRRRRSKKRDTELTQAVTEMLQMANVGFAMIAPCTCASLLADDIRATGAHLDTCPQTWPLTGDEGDRLTKAIVAEFEAHPEWVERLSGMTSVVPHIMLAFAVFSIVIERRSRTGRVVVPEGIDVAELAQKMGIDATAV